MSLIFFLAAHPTLVILTVLISSLIVAAKS